MIKKILLILLLIPISYASAMENLFYLTYEPNKNALTRTQIRDITTKAPYFDIIAPQIYDFDKRGKIHGKMDPALIQLAKETHLKLMPLFTNRDFDERQIHAFLRRTGAQNRLIHRMRALALRNHFYGVQFDIENIPAKDREKLTHFFEKAAQFFHKRQLIASITLVPKGNLETPYDRWFFKHWSGAYDTKNLAKSADFITIMTYDLHTSLTTPGPIAPYDWVKRILVQALKTVPANKISLGLPLYSGFWFTGQLKKPGIPKEFSFRSKEKALPFLRAQEILKDSGQKLIWQNQWKTSYVFYEDDNRLTYLFVENVRSFQSKYRLAERYHLRGISAWKLGMEDPVIWGTLNRRRA